jgi:hypothetical protein
MHQALTRNTGLIRMPLKKPMLTGAVLWEPAQDQSTDYLNYVRLILSKSLTKALAFSFARGLL